ncbi:hypothetical protein P6144_08340 [Sphingomonas sp. HITSZ_GF]|uniref:hypothetical protein n=1 Tax=Sphingomonas sp. HITSZ_GF TaxID=3037247 RepID=UPI00240D86E2|nr:hypothetical protein [Sphingomonas sp. HITSZ_GF]MDG2533651.1 hypothetical protein [Sphingomonas sp. HITSZ_GF]
MAHRWTAKLSTAIFVTCVASVGATATQFASSEVSWPTSFQWLTVPPNPWLTIAAIVSGLSTWAAIAQLTTKSVTVGDLERIKEDILSEIRASRGGEMPKNGAGEAGDRENILNLSEESVASIEVDSINSKSARKGIFLALSNLLKSIRAPSRSSALARDFANMLSRTVASHTDRTNAMRERLRKPIRDVTSARIITRILREDLASAISFADQLRVHPPASWPNYELFRIFNKWAGIISAIDTELADIQAMLRAENGTSANAKRGEMLIDYIITEFAILEQSIKAASAAAEELDQAAQQFTN